MPKHTINKKLSSSKAFISKGPGQTIKLGKAIGQILEPGHLVALIGELGTGKTTLTKGIGHGLGIKRTSEIISPSFVLIREYQGRLPIYHFDLYRLDQIEDVQNLGYEEYFYGQGVTIVEWADKIDPLLPDEYLAIELSFADKEKPATIRKINLIAHGRRYQCLLSCLAVSQFQ